MPHVVARLQPPTRGGVLIIVRAHHRRFSPTLLLIPVFLVACTVQAEDYFPPPDSAGGWRTAAGAEQVRRLAGLDLHQLDLAFDFTGRCSQNGGLLVVRHGYLA